MSNYPKRVICTNWAQIPGITIGKIYNVLEINKLTAIDSYCISYRIVNDYGIASDYHEKFFCPVDDTISEKCETTPQVTQEPEILSPSQPNMRVDGWVKCIKNNGLALLGKWYMISYVKINSDGYYVFEIKDEAMCSGYNKNKFQSDNFDCDNALPYNPEELLIQTHEEIKSTIENNASVPEIDMVNNPPHYTFGGIECLDAIKAQLGKDGYIAFLRGQIAKYNWRLMHKNNPLEDAKKIQYYTNKLVEELENGDEIKN